MRQVPVDLKWSNAYGMLVTNWLIYFDFRTIQVLPVLNAWFMKFIWVWFDHSLFMLFSGAKTTLAGILLANTLGENRQFSLQIMFTSCHFNSVIVWYFPSKFAHMYLCGIHYQLLWSNCNKVNSFKDVDAINWDNACRGPDGTSAWPRSLHEPSIHLG